MITREFNKAISVPRSLKVTPERVDLWIDSLQSELAPGIELGARLYAVQEAINNLNQIAVLIQKRRKLYML